VANYTEKKPKISMENPHNCKQSTSVFYDGARLLTKKRQNANYWENADKKQMTLLTIERKAPQLLTMASSQTKWSTVVIFFYFF
jgi:hypothetical protein